MKKLNAIIISAVAVGMTFTSCTKSESNPPSNINPALTEINIEGKWVFDKYTEIIGGVASEEKNVNNPNCVGVVNYLDLKNAGVCEEGNVNPRTPDDDPCTFTKYFGTWSFKNNILHVEEKVQDNPGTSSDYVLDYVLVSATTSKLTLKCTRPEDSSRIYIFDLIKQ